MVELSKIVLLTSVLVTGFMLWCPAFAETPEESGSAETKAPTSKKPALSDPDVRRGQMMVRAYCSVCHGPEGKGGRGPNLIGGNLRRGTSDEALLNNIKNGVPGTDMLGFGDWGDNDQSYRQIISYIRAATTEPPPPPGGSKENGKRLVAKHNCRNCHWIESSGGRRGPDLSMSGASVDYIRESILDPDANFRKEPGYQHEPYQKVTVITVWGETFEGRWLNENSYFIQLIDEKEKLRTLTKASIEAIIKPPQSLMPSFAELLTEEELKDLIAYVFSLRTQVQDGKGAE